MIVCFDKYPEYRKSMLASKSKSDLEIPYGPEWGFSRLVHHLLKKRYHRKTIRDYFTVKFEIRNAFIENTDEKQVKKKLSGIRPVDVSTIRHNTPLWYGK